MKSTEEATMRGVICPGGKKGGKMPDPLRGPAQGHTL